MPKVSICMVNGPKESFKGIIKDEIKVLYNYRTIGNLKKLRNFVYTSIVISGRNESTEKLQHK